jgi:hypothetical protein
MKLPEDLKNKIKELRNIDVNKGVRFIHNYNLFFLSSYESSFYLYHYHYTIKGCYRFCFHVIGNKYVLKYKPTEPSIKLMLGCAASQIVEEQGELIKTAFSEIEIVVEVDDAWGICKITHVNGLEVAH